MYGLLNKKPDCLAGLFSLKIYKLVRWLEYFLVNWLVDLNGF
jgi:hypothetical protein